MKWFREALIDYDTVEDVLQGIDDFKKEFQALAEERAELVKKLEDAKTEEDIKALNVMYDAYSSRLSGNIHNIAWGLANDYRAPLLGNLHRDLFKKYDEILKSKEK